MWVALIAMWGLDGFLFYLAINKPKGCSSLFWLLPIIATIIVVGMTIKLFYWFGIIDYQLIQVVP